MANFISVAKTSDLLPGTKKAVFAAGKHIMIINADGRFFALDNICTHAGCALATEGEVSGQVITCGCHGSKFNITSGAVVGPPAKLPLTSYTVKVEGTDVMVGV